MLSENPKSRNSGRMCATAGDKRKMCNLYSITTNQAAIIALFGAVNHNVGNLPPMPGVFPDYVRPRLQCATAAEEVV
jgi:hypothetical protein